MQDLQKAFSEIEHKVAGLSGNVYQRFLICFHKTNDPKYSKIMCSISGGADSDIMLDWIYAADIDKKVTYVWFNTGLATDAEKRHLVDLEKKYKIKIKRIKSKKCIPTSCKKHGQPFLTKKVSENLHRLQRNNFKWEDESIEVLLRRYCKIVSNPKNPKNYHFRNGEYWKGCASALRWWCNDFGKRSSFNICKHYMLKEFIMDNPPDFAVSAICCSHTKKAPGKKELKSGEYGLSTTGVRQSEGGERATAYNSCFSAHCDKADDFRPLFFISDLEKQSYKEVNGIIYSDCYEVWGLVRTGCAGCPFGSRFEAELELLRQYEPKLYVAAQNIFGNSYDYTRRYRDYKAKTPMERYIDKIQKDEGVKLWKD